MKNPAPYSEEWHLQQAAIFDMIARRHDRRGMFRDGEKARDSRNYHRERAQAEAKRAEA